MPLRRPPARSCATSYCRRFLVGLTNAKTAVFFDPDIS